MSSSSSDSLGGLLSSLEGDLNSLLSDVASDIATALDLPDFLNVHLMDYCEGTYEPNATDRHASENITLCSNRTVGFHFQPTKIIQDHLPSGITLDDIHWPQEVENAERDIKIASIAMIVLYIIGISFAGLAILGAVWGIFTEGRLSAFINFVIDLVSLISKTSSMPAPTDCD